MEPKIDSEMLGIIAWKTLFGEDFEDMPDPNKPENVAYYKAKQKEKAEKLTRFFKGPGNILFEKWQARVRSGMFSLMTQSIPHCECNLSKEIRELQYLVKLLAESTMVMENK